MKEETPFGGFHNRLQLNGFQQEFLKRHGGTEEGRNVDGGKGKARGFGIWGEAGAKDEL